MIPSFETGAIFKVVNEASPAILKIAREIEALDKLAKTAAKSLTALGSIKMPVLLGELGSVSKSLGGIRSEAVLARDALDTLRIPQGAARSLLTLERRLAAVNAEASKAAASFARIAIPASAGLPALGGGGGGGIRGAARRGAPGSPHFGGVHVPLPGSGGMHFGGNAGLAALGILGYGAIEEGKIEDVVARAMLTGQLNVDSGMTQTAAAKQLRDIIQRVSAKTGFGPEAVGESILKTERQFGGLPFDKRMALEETLLPFAASEARMKETTLPEAFEAMVGLAHMTGTYDPDKMPELMRKFQFASMITPAGIGSFQNALSYSMPMMSAGLDMDPSSTMFLTAMMQTAGVKNSKSGTWLRSFFENAEPKVGDDLSKTAKAHNQALREMGLLDAQDHVSWQVKGQDGKVDWDASILKMSEIINGFTSKTDPATRLSTIRTAFGERGGGFASLMNLKDFIGQFPVLQEKMRNFQGGDDVLKSLSEGSPVQQVRSAWADVQNVMMDIGKITLPALMAPLRGFDDLLKAISATAGFVDDALGHSKESDALVSNRGFWGLSSAAGHLGDAWNHIFGGKPSGNPAANPLLNGAIPAARDFTADIPVGTEKSGTFFVPGFGMTDGDGKSLAVMTVHDGVLQALNDWGGSGSSGGGGGGSFGFGVGGSGGRGLGAALLHKSLRHGHDVLATAPLGTIGPHGSLTALIDSESSLAGIPSSWMEGIRAGESLHGRGYDIGDHGDSFGPFQLDRAGGRLGAIFQRETGLNLADPSTIPAQVRWVARYLKKHGGVPSGTWFGYHGPRNANPNWGDAGYRPLPSNPPSDKQSENHSHIYLDGKKIAHVVTQHQTRHAWAPRQAPYFDTRGYAASPDIGFATG